MSNCWWITPIEKLTRDSTFSRHDRFAVHIPCCQRCWPLTHMEIWCPPSLFPSPELQDSTVGPHPFALGKMYANWARKWPSLVVTPDCWPIRCFPMNIAVLAGTSYGYAGWGQIVYMFDIVLYSVCFEFLYSIYVRIKCVSDSLCLYQRSEVIQSCLERSAIVF